MLWFRAPMFTKVLPTSTWPTPWIPPGLGVWHPHPHPPQLVLHPKLSHPHSLQLSNMTSTGFHSLPTQLRQQLLRPTQFLSPTLHPSRAVLGPTQRAVRASLAHPICRSIILRTGYRTHNTWPTISNTINTILITTIIVEVVMVLGMVSNISRAQMFHHLLAILKMRMKGKDEGK